MTTCRLVIEDEVNIKVENLPVDVRRRISNSLKFEVPYAKHMPQFKLGRWDGKVAFFGIGGTGYVNHLDKVIEILNSCGVEISEIDDRREKVSLDFDKITEDYWGSTCWPRGHPAEGEPIKLRDYQVEVINNFLSNPQALQEVATGAGKCQPYSSKVLTPTGWRTMKNIQPGDKVVTPEGQSADVLNVFEPGYKDVYEITFSDGRTARCCKDHVWKIYNIEWKRSKTGPWRNITTEELIKLKNNTKRSIGIPLPTMEKDNADSNLPIDPWLLGFLIGDGSFRNKKLGFSSADNELVEKVKSKLPDEYVVKHIENYDYCIKFANEYIQRKLHSENIKTKDRNEKGHIVNSSFTSSNYFIKTLSELGLGETHSHTKFIPEIYMQGSYEQRKNLLQGLVDSDGTIDKSSIKFSTVSQKLSDDFVELVRSLGGVARTFTKTDCTYVYKGERRKCRDSYTVATKFREPWEFVSLTRKKEQTNFKYQYGETLKLNVESIRKVSNEPVKCILIDSPEHLYLTDDYVVTHNTIITATLSKKVEPYGRSIVVVPNKSLVAQTEEDYVNCGLDVGVYYGDRKELGKTHTICTWQSLNVLDKRNKNGDEVLSLAEFLSEVSTVIIDECFDGETLITTPQGKTPIKDLKAGDKVINLCEETQKYKEDTIVKVHKNLLHTESEKMLELQFDNGVKTQVTANHKFLTNTGWVRADELTSDLDIVDINTFS